MQLAWVTNQAPKKAKQHGVKLLVIREPNNTDWEDDQSNPLIKALDINIMHESAARITQFLPKIDSNWVKENTNIDTSKPLKLTGRNDEILIEDLEKNEKYSLLQLVENLGHTNDSLQGCLTKQAHLSHAFIHRGKIKLKLLPYKVDYQKSAPQKIPLQIDPLQETARCY